jgi:UDP-2,4-diacetamido-2,4,6-trideoxy-beta-L-altropyranose hydrolase
MMKLLIRADATIQMGTGHLMRCLALAQAVKHQGGIVYFAIFACPVPLQKRLIAEEFKLRYLLGCELGSLLDAQKTAQFAEQLQCDWVCVDGYQFGADYQQSLSTLGRRSIVLDDYGHSSFYYADLVLNQNLSAQKNLYQNRHPNTTLLLGIRYTLLREEFWQWRGWQRQISKVANRILITLGGSDPNNTTAWILEAFQNIQDQIFNITVIVGNSNPHRNALIKQVQHSIHEVDLVFDTTDMPNYLVNVDLAISAGGSTTWELAFLGLPSIIVTLADNQKAIAQALHDQGIAISVGAASELNPRQFVNVVQQLANNPEQRQVMSQKGQALIDGEGVDRVIMAMQGDRIRLRPAKWQDCEQIWQWANESTTRQASFQSKPIPWEEHVQWFRQKLEEVNSIFWIAIDAQDCSIGQVRFDPISTDVMQISLSVAPNARNQGFGVEMLKAAVQQIFCNSKIIAISAWIKPENSASIRTFEMVQFIKIGTEYKDGHPALHYQFKKSVEAPLS